MPRTSHPGLSSLSACPSTPCTPNACAPVFLLAASRLLIQATTRCETLSSKAGRLLQRCRAVSSFHHPTTEKRDCLCSNHCRSLKRYETYAALRAACIGNCSSSFRSRRQTLCPCPCDPAHNPAARPSNLSPASSAYSLPFLLSLPLARSSPLSRTDTAPSYPPALRSHPPCPLDTGCSASSATLRIPPPCRM